MQSFEEWYEQRYYDSNWMVIVQLREAFEAGAGKGVHCYSHSCMHNDADYCKTKPSIDCNGRCMNEWYDDE
jgi:hypothetical protein